jgi:hypothetical protein
MNLIEARLWYHVKLGVSVVASIEVAPACYIELGITPSVVYMLVEQPGRDRSYLQGIYII